jgi:hypothetical protein
MHSKEKIIFFFADFCLKRVLTRIGVMIAVVFVAESVPSFGPLLDLIGSSAMTLNSLIFPCLFYMYLRTKEHKAEEEMQKKLDSVSSHVDYVFKSKQNVTAECVKDQPTSFLE